MENNLDYFVFPSLQWKLIQIILYNSENRSHENRKEIVPPYWATFESSPNIKKIQKRHLFFFEKLPSNPFLYPVSRLKIPSLNHWTTHKKQTRSRLIKRMSLLIHHDNEMVVVVALQERFSSLNVYIVSRRHLNWSIFSDLTNNSFLDIIIHS